MEDENATITKILTVSDVAVLLQVNKRTVQTMLRQKKIKGFKVGAGKGQWRFTERDIFEYIRMARNERENDD